MWLDLSPLERVVVDPVHGPRRATDGDTPARRVTPQACPRHDGGRAPAAFLEGVAFDRIRPEPDIGHAPTWGAGAASGLGGMKPIKRDTP